MAEGKNIYCELCDHRNEINTADVWCNDCQEAFCQQCVKVHEVTKILRNHHIISVADHLKSESYSFNQVCEDHKRKSELFCSYHDQVICLKCVQLYHNGCDVIELKEATKGANSSEAMSELKECINIMTEDIERGIERCNKSDEFVNDHERMIKRKINYMREKIDVHLNRLQQKLLKELHEICEKQKLQLSDFRNRLTKKQSNLKEVQEQTLLMEKIASDSQIFIGIRKLNNTIYQDKRVIEEATNFFPKCHFELHINKELESFIKNFATFGEIVVTKGFYPSAFREPKAKQAQIVSVSKTSVETDVKLKLKQTIRIQRGNMDLNITGCAILQDKRLMFADCDSRRLVIHKEDGSFDYFIKLPESPFDITPFRENSVLVSYRGQKKIHLDIVNIFTYEIKTYIFELANHCCWGVCHDSEDIFFIAYPDGIRKIELCTKTSTTIPVNIHNCFNMTTHNKKLYYTNRANKTLYCSDQNGLTIWSFRDEKLHSTPYSSVPLTCDGDGNVYVAGPSENVVLFIKKDGKSRTILLDRQINLTNLDVYSFQRRQTSCWCVIKEMDMLQYTVLLNKTRLLMVIT